MKFSFVLCVKHFTISSGVYILPTNFIKDSNNKLCLNRLKAFGAESWGLTGTPMDLRVLPSVYVVHANGAYVYVVTSSFVDYSGRAV
jgi:hypothetical protein